SGHGKGAPDGVGDLLKRTADRLVESGRNINELHILLDELRKSFPNVSLCCIFSEDIAKWDIIPESLSAFSGTMEIHQLTWCHTDKDLIRARRLSCFKCNLSNEYSHYGLGSISLQIIVKRPFYSAVYSDSEPFEIDEFMVIEWPAQSQVSLVSDFLVSFPELYSFKVYYVEKLSRKAAQLNS
ncbi:hypothetical protein HHI36_005548, partial [Cryptolaemus montrouzieri]